MKLLILGGTVFLGHHLVEAALNRQHEVVLFHRGLSNPGLFPELEHIRGERDGGLDVLRGRQWDAVIDTCGFVPRIVEASARFLADSTGRYVFISSISVYKDFSAAGIDEQYPVAQLEDETGEEVTAETYGALKALCERAVERALPGRVLTIRPGLIVGPHDPTDRFTYWPHRIARGGEVLAPGQPERPIQFIDVRDLAAWIIQLIETHTPGVYNAVGPQSQLTMQQFLEECRRVSESDVSFQWVSEKFLLHHHVVPYVEMPLWVPSEMIGFGTVNCAKALQTGLTFRSLTDTIQATRAWDAVRPTPYELQAGLSSEREAALLQTWKATGQR